MIVWECVRCAKSEDGPTRFQMLVADDHGPYEPNFCPNCGADKSHLMKEDEPSKVNCEATLVLGDPFNDYPLTFHCGLLAGHKGSHEKRSSQPRDRGDIIVRWD